MPTMLSTVSLCRATASRAIGWLASAAAVLALGVHSASAQVISPAPTAQSVPYFQNFGAVNFSAPPAGWVILNGLSGVSVNTQLSAEASAPGATPTTVISTLATTTGAVFSDAVAGNARLAIVQSSNAPNGVNQPVLAISTIGASSIVLRYDLVTVVANLRTIGIVAQYRLANTGSWITLPSVTGNPYTQSGGMVGTVTPVRVVLPAACNNQALVQIRWANWRGVEAGSSSAAAIDNVSVNANRDSIGSSATINGSIGANEYGPLNAYTFAGGGTGFGGMLGNGSVAMSSDGTNLSIGLTPGVTITGDNTAVIFLNTRAGGVSTPTALTVDINTRDRRSVARLLNGASLPAGFDADFAIAFTSSNIFLFEIVPPGLTDLSSGTTRFYSAAFPEIRIALATLGLSAASNVDFFAGLTNGASPDTFMANESIPGMATLNTGGNPGNSGGSLSAFARFQVYAPPPSITTQPTDFAMCAGATATFSVVAASVESPITYQWQQSGLIGGPYINVLAAGNLASFQFLSLGNAPNSTNHYRCVVSSVAGSTITSPALLTVNALPASIPTAPPSYTGFVGIAQTVAVTPTGGNTVIDWYSSTTSQVVLPSGLGTNSYSFTPTIVGNNIVYAGERNATTGCNALVRRAVIISAAAVVPTSISTQPSGSTVCIGSPFSVTVAALGSVLSYQWKLDGIDVSGATSATYTVASPTVANAGSYTVVVTGLSGTVTSNAASVVVNPATAITLQPVGGTACTGSPLNLSVTASGTGLTYQWRNGGSPIGGATSASFSATTSGSYDVVVSGSCGAPVTSSAAVVVINPATAITTQPVGGTVCTGSPILLSVVASGTGLSYQWRNGLVNIGGATSASFSATTSGSFDVVVTGTCGTPVTSSVAVVVIDPATAITTQPTATAACSGGSASFSVIASGAGLSYQWKLNGGDIIGQTNASLTVNPAVAGSYSVTVSGTCGPSVASNIASLTVIDSSTTAYIDSAYAGLPNGTIVTFPASGGTGAHLIGCNAFASIQSGINTVTNSTVLVAAGTYDEDLTINLAGLNLLGAGPGISIIRGTMADTTVATIRINASNVTVAGFTITRNGNNPADWNDPLNPLNTAGIAIQGPGLTGSTIRDNLITGNRTGIDINNTSGHTIRNNVINDNRTGMLLRNQTDNLTVKENSIANNWTVGILFIDGSGNTNVPPQSATGSVFANNTITGNWYGQIEDRGNTLIPVYIKNFSGNWLGTTTPVISNISAGEPGYGAQIPVAFGGAAVPPGGQPDIKGAASANFDYTPMLAVGTDTDISTGGGIYGFQGNYSSLVVASQLAQTGSTGRVQEGHNLVNVGGTVSVQAGSYAENVIISQHIKLNGAGSGGGVLAGNPATDTIIAPASGAAITIDDVGGASAVNRLMVTNLRTQGASQGVRVLAASSQTRSFFTFDNLAAIANSSHGLSFEPATVGGGLTDIIVQNSFFNNTGNVGIANSNLATLSGLIIDNCEFKNNFSLGVYIGGVDGSFTPTNITVSNSTFTDNGSSIQAGTGHLSFFWFNGNATLSNLSLSMSGSNITRQPLQFRGWGSASTATWQPLGSVSLSNVSISGRSNRPAAFIQRYSSLANLSLSNVNLAGVISTNAPGTGFATAMQLTHTGVTPVALNNTIFPCQGTGFVGLFVESTGGAAADCTTVFTGASTLAQKELCVLDGDDFAGLGNVSFTDAGINVGGQPTSQIVCSGSNAVFSVTATNATSFQWRLAGIDIIGETAASITTNIAGSYDVVIGGLCGPVTSSAATLTVNPITAITGPPVGGSVCTGSPILLSVVASGTGLTYQWRNGGSPIGGATSASFSATTSGSYDVVVSGSCGAPVTSSAAVVVIDPATAITTQPVGGTVCTGSPLNLSVVASGAGLSYQWRNGGSPIGGATSASFSATTSGSYDVVVTGACGTVTSTPVSVVVNPATAISSQPVGGNICSGSSLNLSVTASGAVLTYQWQLDGNPIGGATSASYLATASGTYAVIVTGTCGAPVTSSAAILLVSGGTSVVFVDDGYIGLPSGTAVNFPANGNPGPYVIGCNAFATVQGGIDAASVTGTVNVAAGDYAQNLIVTKALTLTGPNAGLAGCDAGRGAEAVIRPALGSNVAMPLVYISASNITIAGFSLDGDNTLVTTVNGNLGGANSDANNAVCNGSFDDDVAYPFVHVKSIAISNNKMMSLNDMAVQLWNSGSDPVSDGNTITGNCISNMPGQNIISAGGPYDRIGVIMYNDTYAAVDSNTFDTVAIGVQTGNNFRPMVDGTASISGNTMTTAVVGIFHNLHYSNASPFTVSTNTIGDAGSSNTGIILWSLYAGSTPTVSGNIISGGLSGYEIWNNATTTPIAITGGSVTGAGTGIYAYNVGSYGQGEATTTSISNVIISGSTSRGIFAEDTGNNIVKLSITGSTLNANATGIEASGSDAAVKVQTTSISGGSAAARANLDGKLDLGDCDNNNITGLGSSTGGNTLSGYGFDALSPFAIVNSNSSAQSVVHATSNSWGNGPGQSIELVLSGNGGANSAIIYTSSTGPEITAQPISAALCAPATTTLTVVGINFTGIQWQLNSVDIPGATNASYATGAAGSYTAIFTDACGVSTTSNAAVVTITPTTAIGTQPVGGSICSGSDLVLSVIASGTGLSYQWQLDGVDIGGATSASYTANASGSYTVIVTGTCGALTSNAAIVVVNPLTAITLQPVGSTLCAGSPLSLGVTASGAGLSYQWQLGGNDITGATSSTYSVGSAAAINAGSYTVIIIGACGTPVTSTPVSVVVNPATDITTQPVGGTVCTGTPLNLSVTASGVGLTYQWRNGGVDIGGATSASYLATASGTYAVIVTGTCGAVTSSNAVVLVVSPALATFVDDDYIGLPGGTIVTFPATGGSGIHIIGCDAFATVQGGIDAVLASGTVNVAAGSYAESPNVNKAVSLLGANDNVHAQYNVRSAEAIVQGTFILASNDVAIRGFKINPTVASAFGVRAFSGNSIHNNVALRFNWFDGCYDSPVRMGLGFGGGVSSSNWTVSDNRISNIQGNDRTGLILFNITGLTIERNYIRHDNPASSGRRGLNLDGSRTALIASNDINLGLVAPLLTDPANFAAARYSMLLSMSDRSSSDIRVLNNTLGGSFDSIVTLGNGDLSNVEIAGNDLRDLVIGFRSQAGVNTPVGSVSNISIRNNTFVTSNRCIFFQAGVQGGSSADPYSGLSVSENSLTRTDTSAGLARIEVQTGAVFSPSNDPVTASCNWFGSAAAQNVAAATVGTNLVTTPWLVSGVDAAPGTIGFQVNPGTCIGTAVSLVVTTTTNVTCPSGLDGAVNITASGGTGPYSYLWTNSAITEDLTGVGAGLYSVIVTDANGSTATTAATLTELFTATLIGTQPVGGSICSGSDLVLSVIASGSGLSYQWQLGGVNIGGATSASYTANASGSYTVIVSGTCGALTSSAAIVVVNPITAITTQPVGSTLCEGSPLSLSVTANGAGLSYQWQLGGSDIFGATSSTYSVGSAAAINAGSYTVIITGACGTPVTSTPVSVVVNTAPAVVNLSSGGTLCVGFPFSIGASASGTSPLSYQWRRNTVNLAGQTNPTLNIAALLSGDAGNYDVIVSNSCGTFTSSVFALVVGVAPSISSQPVNSNTAIGGIATFSVGATGTPGPLNYQWFRNSIALTNVGSFSGVTTPVLTVNPANLLNPGNYHVTISNFCGAVTSNTAVLAVGTAPNITLEPLSTFLRVGECITFTSAAVGAPTLTYQWFKNGSPLLDGGSISGATTTSLTICPISGSDGASYTMVATNIYGSDTSNPAVLTIDPSCNCADIVGGTGNPLGDGSIDGNDFQAFLNAFAADDPLADIVGGDGNCGPDGSVDGNDFQAFLNLFAAGCP